jgi:hypothetical protein
MVALRNDGGKRSPEGDQRERVKDTDMIGKCGRHIHVCEWNKIKTSHSEKKRVKKKRREGRGKKREEKRERRERR